MDIRFCDDTRQVDEDAYLRDFIRAVEHKDMEYIKFIVPMIKDQQHVVHTSLDDCGSYLKMAEEDSSRYDMILGHGLLLAAFDGCYETAQYLLQQETPVNTQNLDGDTPLIKACERGNADIVRLLLSHGADINLTNLVGSSALQWTSRFTERADIVDLLLTYDALDINLTTHKHGRTALHSAAEHDVSGCIVASLLKRNALVNMTDKEGKTPLYLAAERGHLSNVKLLIEFGAYVNMRTYKLGYTSLHAATKNCHADVAMTLVKCGAIISITDELGLTALDVATRHSGMAQGMEYSHTKDFLTHQASELQSNEVIRMREMFVVLCELVTESQCASLFEELFGSSEAMDECVKNIPLRTSEVSLSVLVLHLLNCWLDDNREHRALFWVLMRALRDHHLPQVASRMIEEFWDEEETVCLYDS